MSALSTLGRSQGEQLERFLADSTESSLLRELVETHCLLELSKLATGGLDLFAYAETVVGVVTQFFSVTGCAVRIEVDGLPAVKASFGDVDHANPQASFALTIGETTVGGLIVSGPPNHASSAEFFNTAAGNVSAALTTIVETERLRRSASTATTLQAAATLGEHRSDQAVTDLAVALAALPAATGATVRVDHALFGPPLEVASGEAGVLSEIRQADLDPGCLTVEVSWSSQPTAADLNTLDQALAAAASSIAQTAQLRQLEADVETDPLTGVGNRRRAERQLTEAFARAERHGEPLTLFYLDLDHFKRVNDTLGHAAGDEVLRTFAQGICRDVRAYDTVARLGGEEFLVISPSLDAVGAASLAARFRAHTPRWVASALPAAWTQTVSVGVAVYPDSAHTADGLLRAADRAMYRAKEAGRDRSEFAKEAD